MENPTLFTEISDPLFVKELKRLDALGKQGVGPMRSFLQANGGMHRVISLLRAGGKRSIPKDDEPEGFPEWYAAYPRHESRFDAANAYRNAVIRDKRASRSTVLIAAKSYASHCASLGIEKQHIKLPATWINKGCWLDEYTDPTPGPTEGEKMEPEAVWEKRCEIYYGLNQECPKGTWSKTWGKKPDEFGFARTDIAHRIKLRAV